MEYSFKQNNGLGFSDNEFDDVRRCDASECGKWSSGSGNDVVVCGVLCISLYSLRLKPAIVLDGRTDSIPHLILSCDIFPCSLLSKSLYIRHSMYTLIIMIWYDSMWYGSG